MEHNWQKISTGVQWEKKRLEEAKKSEKTSGGDTLPKECGRTAWTEYLFSAMENWNVREHQHVDDCLTAKLHQDCTTLVVIDVLFGGAMVLDANVDWGLKTVISLSWTVNYCVVSRAMRLMTFARAMAAKERDGEVVSIADNTPPTMNFLHNSDTQWNHLVIPTAVVSTRLE